MSLFELEKPTTPPAISLRPYQKDATDAILSAMDRGVQRGLIVLPTGLGKTLTVSSLIRSMSESSDFKSLFIAHRRELLNQAQGAISALNPHLSVQIESGEDRATRNAQVVVASTQSINSESTSRLDWFNPTLVVQDEAHRAMAEGNQRIYRRTGCFDSGGPFLLGVTATPHRLDNKMLSGAHESVFQEILFTYSLAKAIKEGWLVDLVGYKAESDTDLSGVKTTAGEYNMKDLEEAVNTEARNELAFKTWDRIANKETTIIFCAGVDHAKEVAEVFKARGVKAASVDGSMKREERDQIIADFKSGKIQVLTNMDIATEGFDFPPTSCIVMLRPTQSWSLYVQCVGRGLRALAGTVNDSMTPAERKAAILSSPKPRCIVIDVADVTTKFNANKAPKVTDSPNLNGMVGLPKNLDIEGKTLAEAVEAFDELDEMVKASAFKFPTSFSGLNAKITLINMLADTDVPEEAVAAKARYQWLKSNDLKYMLNCGSSDVLKRQQAMLVGDMLGKWNLHLSCIEAATDLPQLKVIPMPDDMDKIFLAAEHEIRSAFPGVENLVSRENKWMKAGASPAQIGLLKKLGAPEEVLSSLDKGKASLMISRLMEMKQNEKSATKAR